MFKSLKKVISVAVCGMNLFVIAPAADAYVEQISTLSNGTKVFVDTDLMKADDAFLHVMLYYGVPEGGHKNEHPRWYGSWDGIRTYCATGRSSNISPNAKIRAYRLVPGTDEWKIWNDCYYLYGQTH